MRWWKNFLAFLTKVGKMESVEVATESFQVASVNWVIVGEYFKIESSAPDEDGFISEKRIPMIFISGNFGYREFIGTGAYMAQAMVLKEAVEKYKKVWRLSGCFFYACFICRANEAGATSRAQNSRTYFAQRQIFARFPFYSLSFIYLRSSILPSRYLLFSEI